MAPKGSTPKRQTTAKDAPKPPAKGPTSGESPSTPLAEAKTSLAGLPARHVHHVVRILAPYGGAGDRGSPMWSGMVADEEIGKIMVEEGLDLLAVESLGLGPDGASTLWVLREPPEGAPRYTEVHHVMRTMAGGVGGEEAVSGFNADLYLSSYIADGWLLRFARVLGMGPAGVSMLWVLVR